MSTSKVSKYTNHNNNIIIAISISNSSNSSTVRQYTTRWLQWQATTHNRECRGDSNWYTPCRGRTWPTRHTLDFRRLSRVKIIHKSLLPRWSLGTQPHSPSKSKSTTRSREMWFDKVVTKATWLNGPHKTRHAVSTKLKDCHRGQNGAVFNRHR
jgi:hypothetical protein